MKEVLKNPTIKQMIAYLSKFDPDTPFRIEDPDTNWTINIIHASKNDEGVWLTGDYNEMESD